MENFLSPICNAAIHAQSIKTEDKRILAKMNYILCHAQRMWQQHAKFSQVSICINTEQKICILKHAHTSPEQ
jgi:hypothetical protein